MRTLLGLLIALQVPPAWIPVWQGREPIKYCIAPEMEQFRPEVTSAFWTWVGMTGLPAYETRNCIEARTIAYRLGYCGGRLGAGLYPPPVPFPEPAAGDVYADITQPWSWPIARPYLQAVLAHETGHAIGLGDSLATSDLMYPNLIVPGRYPSLSEYRMVSCLYRGWCW